MGLFKKAAVWTDIHFGAKNNSILHNMDCLEFTEWAIKQAKENNCETCLFLGDYFNSRAAINVNTLKYGIQAIRLMSESFENVYIISGNHDIYYRDSREISSLEFSREFPNVTLIDEIFTKDNVSIIPWLVKDDHKKLKKLKSKYIFGHFEFSNFLMNAMIRMPEHGGLKHSDLPEADYIFSGHFHKRQQQKNIVYIGNCFPHNYSDAWDDERGMMILEWDGQPDYITWENAPKYRTINLTQLLDDPSFYLKEKMYVRVTLDVECSYEEVNFVKETFMKQYNLRELSLIPNKERNSLDVGNDDSEIIFESVHVIITREISNIESDIYDNSRLLSIYNNL